MTPRKGYSDAYIGVCAACLDQDPRHEDHCSEPIPDGMRVITSRITGDVSAVCDSCGFRVFCWDCGCDLAHDCGTVPA